MPPRNDPFPAPEELSDPIEWARMASWTPFECAAISLGMEPRSIVRDPRDFGNSYDETRFSEEFSRRLALIENALIIPDELEGIFEGTGEINKVAPLEFIRWCSKKKIDLHPAIITFFDVDSKDNKSVDVQALRDRISQLEGELRKDKKIEKKLSPRELLDQAEAMLRGLLPKEYPGPDFEYFRDDAKKHCMENIPGLSGEQFKQAWKGKDVVPNWATQHGPKPKKKPTQPPSETKPID